MDVITICNQHCWYCYARPESNPGNKWGQVMKFENIKRMLDGVRMIKYNIILSLLGGEPTLHPRINEIIKYASEIPNIKKLELFTNGRKPLNLMPSPKLYVNFSFHPSQTDGKNIIQNALKLKKDNITFSISCLFEKETPRFYEFLEELKQNGLFQFAKIGIVDSHIPSRPLKVKIPKNETFQKINEKEFLLDGKSYSLDELREQKLNCFYGWKCYKNCLKISVDGKISIMGGKNECLTFDEFKNYSVREDICSDFCCDDDNNLIHNRKILE